MNDLLPAPIARTVKAWLSLISVVVSAIVAAVDGAPKWIAVAGAVIASVLVYLGKNTDTTPEPPTAVK